MGYRRKTPVYVLKWGEDDELHGLEVRAKGSSVGQLMDLMNLAGIGEAGRKFSMSDVKEMNGLFDLFASKLISWNLEDDETGEPIGFEPILIDDLDNDGVRVTRRETPREAKVRVLREQDMDFVMAMIFAWLDGVIGTPAPLDENSPGGEPAAEGSIPMEILSLSPVS